MHIIQSGKNLFNETKHTNVNITKELQRQLDTVTLHFDEHGQKSKGLFLEIREIAKQFSYDVEAFLEVIVWAEDRRWPKGEDGKRSGDMKLPDTWRSYKSHLKAAIEFGFDLDEYPSKNSLVDALSARRKADKVESDEATKLEQDVQLDEMASNLNITREELDNSIIVPDNEGANQLVIGEMRELLNSIALLSLEQQRTLVDTFKTEVEAIVSQEYDELVSVVNA